MLLLIDEAFIIKIRHGLRPGLWLSDDVCNIFNSYRKPRINSVFVFGTGSFDEGIFCEAKRHKP